ncbi:MAG TPA: alpha/beta fold hydrolase, partial [Longimicrobium sp.]
DVVLNGRPYPRLDLAGANAVVEAGSEVVRLALAEMLGEGGAGQALQALLGLVPPTDDRDAGPEYLLDVPTLAADPLRAIANVHRARLAEPPRDGEPPEHGWQHLFAEVAALLGVDRSDASTRRVAGAGTPADPWRVALAGEPGASLELAAWNAADETTPAGAQLLRLGVRMAAGSAPWQVAWRGELLGFDLLPDGPGATRFLGAQHLSISLSPVSSGTTAAGVAFEAAGVWAAAEWVPGQPARCGLEVRDLVVSGGGERVGPVSLRLPAAAFDPAAADLGLGIAPDTLMALLRLLVAEGLRGWGGDAAFVAGGLLGVHRRLGGLPADWPLLEAPGGIGALLEDPAAAVRAQAARLAGGVSADGTPFLLGALPWLRALLAGDLPPAPTDEPLLDLGVPGGGAYAHPWVLPLAGDGAELLCWMEPDGPPAAWQRRSAERLRTAMDGASLLRLLDDALQLLPGVEPALRGRTGAMLDRLGEWLGDGDGLVSFASQQVAGDGWSMGAAVDAPHHELPSAPAAIAQLRAQIDAWAGADAGRAVILLSPPFADHRTWAAYLADAEPRRPADAHFDFRGAGADPLAMELGHVNGAATHYTADLAHGAGPGPARAQLLRVVERVKTLTGKSTVFLAAHSTAGVLARAFAAEHPGLVAGVVTLGTPHAGAQRARRARRLRGAARQRPAPRVHAQAPAHLDLARFHRSLRAERDADAVRHVRGRAEGVRGGPGTAGERIGQLGQQQAARQAGDRQPGDGAGHRTRRVEGVPGIRARVVQRRGQRGHRAAGRRLLRRHPRQVDAEVAEDQLGEAGAVESLAGIGAAPEVGDADVLLRLG